MGHISGPLAPPHNTHPPRNFGLRVYRESGVGSDSNGIKGAKPTKPAKTTEPAEHIKPAEHAKQPLNQPLSQLKNH